ncbi:MAG TPA: hypothetical protein VEA38_14380 [Terriglobales bacterium]|nr:hypothetical protein [Terriglobales bacterium]
MSKASEWAKNPTWPGPACLSHKEPHATAEVFLFGADRPMLVLRRIPGGYASDAMYTPAQALRLARWITDTFGDGAVRPEGTP